MTEENKEEIQEVEEVIEHKTITLALACAMREYKPFVKNKKVSYTTKAGDPVKYSYATLATLRAATDPALNKHGLTITDRNIIRDNKEILISTLRHAFSDDIDESEMDITESSGDMQKFGKLMTYGRRYQYEMLSGRSGEDDTDAKDSERRRGEQHQQQSQPNKPDGNKQKSPLEKTKATYFALLSKNKVFKNDRARHAWQKITGYGISTEKWSEANYKGAVGLIHWRLETNAIDADQLLEYITIKAKSKKGLKKQFLAVMGVAKLTDIKDVGNWKIGMASAALSIDHSLETALTMGQVLIRANQHKGLFAKFLGALELDKVSKMTADQVTKWGDFLITAINSYNAEQSDATKIDVDVLMKGEEEKV